MQVHNKAVFSPKGDYFAFADCHGLLKIWDASSNIVIKQHALPTSINFPLSCTSLTWGPSVENVSNSVNNEIRPKEHQCLVIGTETGEVILYDFIAEKFSTHFVKSQIGAVTDVVWYADTDNLFSCSKDKSIAIWDISTGLLQSKWEAGEEPLQAICVIDNENLLSASTSILWWNIEKQTVIKKFKAHDTPIFTLLPAISTEKSCKSYFLTVAEDDSKINAWVLDSKNSVNAVASFNLLDKLVDIDVTRFFSRESPLVLSAVMKSGTLLLFKHVLNGKTRKNLKPQTTLSVVSKPSGDSTKSSSIPILASKISTDLCSCIIAYGDIDNPVFEKVNIEDCPKNMTLSRERCIIQNDIPELSQVKIYNKMGEYISANGDVSHTNSLPSSPKKRKQKEPDKTTDTSRKEQLDFNNLSELQGTQNTPQSKKKVPRKTPQKSVKTPKIRKDTILSDPHNIVDNLIEGLQTENRALLNMVLLCSDDELIKDSVKLLPVDNLKSTILELQNRLFNREERCVYNSRKWLKEILSNKLDNLRSCEDFQTNLVHLKDFLEQQRVSDTLTKLLKLKGLLNLQRIQQSSTQYDSGDSDTCERME